MLCIYSLRQGDPNDPLAREKNEMGIHIARNSIVAFFKRNTSFFVLSAYLLASDYPDVKDKLSTIPLQNEPV